MRRFASGGILVGALIVGGFLFALIQGRPIPGTGIVFVALGAGLLAGSVWVLLPSFSARVERRFAKMQAGIEEQQKAYLDRMLRKQLIGVVVVFFIEIPIAAELWSLVEWRTWIVAFVGTTVTLLMLLVVIILRRRMSAPQR